MDSEKSGGLCASAFCYRKEAGAKMSFTSSLKKIRQDRVPVCSAVIAAAGASQRMSGEDKLFIEIDGAPVLAHTLAAFQNCGYISETIIVVRDDMTERVIAICEQFGITKAAKLIIGGPTRLLSVLNGVYAVSEKAGLIAIHDGARPCIDPGTIERAILSAAKYNAAAPAVPVSSTIKRVRDGTVTETLDREDIFEVQTPQVFTAELIKAALTNACNRSIDVTDDCKAVEIIGAAVRITEGSRNNIKITTSEDVIIAEAILKAGSAGVRSQKCE